MTSLGNVLVENYAFFLASSPFFQVRLGALVTSKVEAADRAMIVDLEEGAKQFSLAAAGATAAQAPLQ